MLTIREATVDDVDIVYDLIMAIARHHGQEQYVGTSREELRRAGFDEPARFGVLLAEVDGEVAGYVSWTVPYSIWRGREFMQIDDLYVREKFRGRKVGAALMREARVLCRAWGLAVMKWEVESDNHGAIRFYQKLGAEVTEKGICRWAVD
ncbi:GNAT family N-acetyltransferase [Emcibacter nanhaiensis]|uniref:GNAT family N-acetyltransferase n=1 Tax=Emcibacter nanhaiensis TaxID=1505037 RepID=A0A501PC24_9PROT|nr:GNAT family N-acetyltransferase [Emcibacter nanhaiensis]TPD57641.1 GNAT family N-acetyltransferase [Emcibacter nanhaiensis]